MLVLRLADSSSTAAATGATPWWGTPVIAGGFVIIGGLIAFLSSWYVKRGELKRQDVARWDNDILDVCADLLGLAFRMYDKLTPFYEEDTAIWLSNAEPFKVELGRLSNAGYKLGLVASPGLSNAASELINSAWILTGSMHSSPQRLDKADELRDKAAVLYELAREELRANK